MNKRKKEVQSLPKYKDWLLNTLKNKKEAAAYLQTALDEYQKDGNTEALLLAFRQVAVTQGDIAQLAKKTHLYPSRLIFHTYSTTSCTHLWTFFLRKNFEIY